MKRARLAWIAGLALVVACIPELELRPGPCPCAGGFVCCYDGLCRTPIDCEYEERALPPSADGLPIGRDLRCAAQAEDAFFVVDTGGRLTAARKDGSLTSPQPLALDAPGDRGCHIAVDGDRLFVATFTSGNVRGVAVDRSTLTFGRDEILGQVLTPAAVVADDAWLYVIEDATGAVKRLAKRAEADGGAPLEIGRGAPSPRSLVTDGASLFWFADQSMYRLDKTGGQVTHFASTEGEHLAVVGDDLVWLDRRSGEHCTMPRAGGEPRCTTLLRDEATLAELEAAWATQGFFSPAERVIGVGAFIAAGGDLYFSGPDGLNRLDASALRAAPAELATHAVADWPRSLRQRRATHLWADGARVYYWLEGLDTLPSLPTR